MGAIISHKYSRRTEALKFFEPNNSVQKRERNSIIKRETSTFAKDGFDKKRERERAKR